MRKEKDCRAGASPAHLCRGNRSGCPTIDPRTAGPLVAYAFRRIYERKTNRHDAGMTSPQQNKLAMYLAVLGVRAKYNSVWSAMTAIAGRVTRLQGFVTGIGFRFERRRGSIGSMKACSLALGILLTFATAGYAGPERLSGKEVVPRPRASWYADSEWNVSVWGTYAFTGNDYPNFDNSIWVPGLIVIGPDPTAKYDKYLEADHAWGGGIDAKYFFKRYFGLGIEGFVAEASRSTGMITILPPAGFLGSIRVDRFQEERTIGSIMGTFTFRYPIGSSRFAPYAWVGGGAIFGGGEVEKVVVNDPFSGAFLTGFKRDSVTRAIGQFGGGLEVRLTPHIGWINDFSWNVINGRQNNFGMARTGINFAF